MDRCTGHHDITEVMLKTALNTIQQQLYQTILENILKKGENASDQHFVPFLKCFQMALYSGLLVETSKNA